ncbi:GPW/gp25 family protein [Niabella sp. W65]|nr:GPW/gp25 family protein [Niabella sp. W65]MCH7369115.1 GPW/gp25 family protein [Niabella sp. W65]
MLLEEAEINSSLEVLLSTATGERVMLSGYGCDLREFLFEPLTTTLKTLMSDKIKKRFFIMSQGSLRTMF